MRICAIALLIMVECAPSVGAATREFSLPPGEPRATGYAESRLDIRGRKHTFSTSGRIWFDGRNLYRVESGDSFDPGRTQYFIRRGERILMAWPRADSRREPRWDSYPLGWPDMDMLRSHLGLRATMREARLVGTGLMHGMPVEHWRGLGTGRGRQVVDVWASTDKRFPLVLRVERRSDDSSSVWAITRLDLRSPLPDNIFTSQVHPRPGLLAMLKTRYWPPSIILVWHLVCLVCYAGLMLSLSAGASKGGRRRAGLSALWGLGVLALLFAYPKLQMYQLADALLLLGMGAMTFCCLALVWRRTGPPGQVHLLKGTKWTVIPLALAVGLVGVVMARSKLSGVATCMGLHGVPLAFLPWTMANVLFYCADSVAVQEVLFRGYLLSALDSRLRSRRAADAAQAALFSVYHVPRDMLLLGVGPGMVADLAVMFLWGVLFCAMRRRYGNLGAPWLVHFAFNVCLSYFSCSAAYGVIRGVTAALR